MLQEIELGLIRNEFENLKESRFLGEKLNAYCDTVLGWVSALQEASAKSKYDKKIENMVNAQLWTSLNYLKGSTLNDVPHEMLFCLNAVLADWKLSDSVLTTAQSQDRDFHINLSNPGDLISKLIPKCDFPAPLIRVAFPELYRHHPLLNVALYHEIGHYIDKEKGIVSASLALNGEYMALAGDEIRHFKSRGANIVKVEESHRCELFADLLAAAYCGPSIIQFLEHIDLNDMTCETHPSLSKRRKITDKFLKGESDPLIDLFGESLEIRGLGPLGIRYAISAECERALTSFEPPTIANIAEVHGLFPSAWEFYKNYNKSDTRPSWQALSPLQAFDLVNDLTEKAIRNHDIIMRWNYVGP